MKKILAILLSVILVFSLCACGSEKGNGEPTKIKFSATIEDLKKLDGEMIEISGFMSMLSPLNGELIYLMNIPLQNCPFCVPNTNTLSNTIAVKGKNIEFTPQAVKVVGKLVFGEFADSYGYEYEYRVEDAEIIVLDENEISDNMKVYYSLNQNNYIEIAYVMIGNFDKVAFYEDYGFEKTEFDDYGEILFPEYQTIKDTVTSLNENGEYDEFLNILEQIEDIRARMNKSITNKDYDSYKTYQDDVEKIIEDFTNFINKYEM